MRWFRKLLGLGDYPETDEFAQKYMEAMGGFVQETQKFATGVQEFADEIRNRDLEKEILELRERITRLEAVILPMRNGAPAH